MRDKRNFRIVNNEDGLWEEEAEIGTGGDIVVAVMLLQAGAEEGRGKGRVG